MHRQAGQANSKPECPASRSEEKIFGRRAVLEAIRSGRRKISRIVMARGLKGSTFREIVEEAERVGIELTECERKRLDTMAGTEHHQGVLALGSAIADEGLASLLARAHIAREEPFIVVLDGVTDPQNLGAVLRSSEAAGVHGVVLAERKSAPMDRATAKASAGAVEHIPICHVGNLGQTILRLKEEGLKIWSSDADPGATNIYDADLTSGMVIILGSEEKGVSHMLKDRSDGRLKIPMRGKISSLNVSAAAAVILFEVGRQRTLRHQLG